MNYDELQTRVNAFLVSQDLAPVLHAEAYTNVIARIMDGIDKLKANISSKSVTGTYDPYWDRFVE